MKSDKRNQGNSYEEEEILELSKSTIDKATTQNADSELTQYEHGEKISARRYKRTSKNRASNNKPPKWYILVVVIWILGVLAYSVMTSNMIPFIMAVTAFIVAKLDSISSYLPKKKK